MGAHKRSYQIKVGNFATSSLILLKSSLGSGTKSLAPNHPHFNGLDEQFNQTLKHQLQKLVNDHQDDWDELLDNILFAYQTSRQDSTKCTPFLLMYGCEAQLPIALTRVQPEDESQELDFELKLERMLELQKKLHDQAYANIEKAQARQKKQYEAKHNTNTMQDRCWRQSACQINEK